VNRASSIRRKIVWYSYSIISPSHCRLWLTCKLDWFPILGLIIISRMFRVLTDFTHFGRTTAELHGMRTSKYTLHCF
jgi:hypothetical protein